MTISSNTSEADEAKNAPYRSTRRAARRRRGSHGKSGRRLTIRSEQQQTPDVRKIARAIISMALADAEREAQAQAQADDLKHPDPPSESVDE